jgi:hypothetical protein
VRAARQSARLGKVSVEFVREQRSLFAGGGGEEKLGWCRGEHTL